LIRLTANQIAEAWNKLVPAVNESFPERARSGLADLGGTVLQQVAAGYGQAWYLVRDGEPIAFAVTTIMFDGILGGKFLTLYAIYGFTNISLETYQLGLVELKKFAKEQGCRAILAYTSVERVKRVSEYLGGKTMTVIQLEV